MSKTQHYEYIGKLAFEFINFIRKLNGETDIEEWENLSNERKHFMFNNIKDVLENKDITGRDVHKKWAELRLNKGWKYGEVTDREKKVHDCLVPFDALNFFQKLKDDIFVQVVKSCAAYEYVPSNKELVDNMKAIATFNHGYKLVHINEICNKSEYFNIVSHLLKSMGDCKAILFNSKGIPIRLFNYEDIEVTTVNQIIETDLMEKLDIK